MRVPSDGEPQTARTWGVSNDWVAAPVRKPRDYRKSGRSVRARCVDPGSGGRAGEAGERGRAWPQAQKAAEVRLRKATSIAPTSHRSTAIAADNESGRGSLRQSRRIARGVRRRRRGSRWPAEPTMPPKPVPAREPHQPNREPRRSVTQFGRRFRLRAGCNHGPSTRPVDCSLLTSLAAPLCCARALPAHAV